MLSVGFPKASQAFMKATKEKAQSIATIEFSKNIKVKIEDPKVSDLFIHSCEKVSTTYNNDHTQYKIIGSIRSCHVNMFFFNQFYFFQKNNKTYLRQLKTFESLTFEVYSVNSKEIHLGHLVEYESATRPQYAFSNF